MIESNPDSLSPLVTHRGKVGGNLAVVYRYPLGREPAAVSE